MHNVLNSRQPVSQTSTSSAFGNIVQLKTAQANVRPSVMAAAQQSGIDADFVHLIKEICLLALVEFKPGDIVNSKMLCAEIRYGLSKDKPVNRSNVPGLSKGERLNAGTVILILAKAGELPLVSLGPNKANLQQYRV